MDINIHMVRLQKWAADNPGGIVLVIAIGIAVIFLVGMLYDAITQRKKKKARRRSK